MNIFQVIILAIIEGLTEFLPVSSTGHLIVAEKLFQIVSTDFVKSFNIFIQLGAILAVVWIYLPDILSNKKLYKNIFIAFLPTGVLGLVFYKLIKTYLLDNIFVTVITLFLGGIVLLFIDKFFSNSRQAALNSKKRNFTDYLQIGLFQSLSIIPGVSRSAASIIGGLVVGMTRAEAVKFSFLLAIPTMAAATALDLLKSSISFTGPELQLLGIGFLTSFLTAYLAVKSFTTYIAKHNFVVFGIYRIILAITILLVLKLI